jgi:hypothetical protein
MMIRALVPDVLILLGAALVPAGIAMIFPPAAYVVVGLEMIWLGGVLGKK